MFLALFADRPQRDMKNMKNNNMRSESGFSLLELLVYMSIFSIIVGIAAFGIKDLYNASQTATEQVLAHFKLTRSKAMSETLAYLYQPSDNNTIVVSSRSTCNATESWVANSSLTLNFEGGATMSDTSWFVCINSRGFPDANVDFDIQDAEGRIKNVEIFLGGSIEAT